VPNICENELSVYAFGKGDSEGERKKDQAKKEALLRKLTKQVKSKESVFDFNNLIPSPDWDSTPNEDGELPSEVEEIRNKSNGLLVMSLKKFPVSGRTDERWFDWNRENWGTKWNAGKAEVYVCKYGDHVQFKFQTAWCAPVEILLALRDQYPQLQFNWFYRIEEWEDCGFLHREV